jgi:hypothetical protein
MDERSKAWTILNDERERRPMESFGPEDVALNGWLQVEQEEKAELIDIDTASVKSVKSDPRDRANDAHASELCRRCGGGLRPVEIGATPAEVARLRIGCPAPLRTPLLAWRCEQCGSLSPRFDEIRRHRVGR